MVRTAEELVEHGGFLCGVEGSALAASWIDGVRLFGTLCLRKY